MVDPEDLDPEVLAAAVEAYQNGLGGAAPAADQGFTPAIMSNMEVIRAMGMDPMEMHRPEFAREAMAYRSEVGKQQALQAKAESARAQQQEKLNDPFIRAQNVYGKIGHLAAARTIAKSAGPALFQLGEEVDLGPDQMFAMRPVGDLDMPKPDGTSAKMPAWQVLRANGVDVVPFLGGDEDAKGFRNMAARMAVVMTILHKLEEGYTAAGNISFPYSEKKFDLAQMEGTLARDVSQLRSGSKSMAGVSDKEMEAIERTLPMSAMNMKDTKREGIRRVINTRQQLLGLITRMARMNGVELVQLKPKDALTSGRATKPAGVENIPNGEQSGSSTSGQPR